MIEGGAGTATILYTDIVGSTQMRARLGDVEADFVRRRHDELLRAAVTKHGGTVVKGLGDGILAAFGATAEAVHAARDIQRDIDRANRQTREDRRIEVRVAISAGDVSWEDGDCHGTPVVIAARLCDAADGSQILCDDLVRGLARGRTDLTFTLIGERELKGLPEPVITFEVPWAATVAPNAPLPGPLRRQDGELPFAARAEEHRQVLDAWKRAQVDGRAIVLLAGEPGIGKTRLAAEVARHAHGEGAFVVLGRCDEHVAAAHAPWSELLRHLATIVDDDVIRDHVARHGGELGRIVHDFARRAPDAPPPTESDPDTERLLLFDAVVDLLQGASASQPLVVLLDDAHWADAGSVHLLRHVVSHLDPDARVLVLVTYRDTDIDRTHPLAGSLADLYRAAGAERIALRGLDEAGMRAFLEAAGGQPLAAEGFVLAQRLAAETDGNPFFVTEVLRHLVETGALIQRDGEWVGAVGPGEAGLPEGVRDVIGQRLSRLPDTANDLLRTAAVFGREFDVNLVAAASQVDDDAAIDALDTAIATRLVAEIDDSPGRLTFAHALVRQTLLEELSTNKRIRLHRRIAELLDDRSGTPIELLAHHYLEAAVAGVAPRAIEVASEAAREAYRRFAWEDAIRFYERALEALDTADLDDPGLRSELLAQIALGHHAAGERDTARVHALRAVELARLANDAARLTEAGIAYQGELGVWASPTDPLGAEIMREGLAALGPEHSEVRARALSMLAQGLLLAPGGALTEADAAVAAAREANDDDALGHALLVRAWAVRGALPVAERRVAAEEAIAFARIRGDGFHEIGSLYQYANSLLSGGDLVAAETQFELAAEFRGGLEGWAIADYRTGLAIAQGRFAEAVELCEIAYGLGTALGESIDGVHALQRWLIASYTGDPEQAAVWLEQAQATAIGMAQASSVYAALRAPDAARALAEWTRDILPLVPDILRYSNAHYLSVAALRLDTLDGLESTAAYTEQFAGELLGSDAAILGAADAARGRFAAVRGELDAAVALLDSGHALHERCGLRALGVESGIDLARVLLRRAGPGDADRARTLLDAAATLAADLGMAPAHAEAGALLAG
ncbi:MAG TPA: AAA family ATPase [Acidimicrobiia bacterium]|nr:AAA family ATPase [Acidimicrobiia bacterium]